MNIVFACVHIQRSTRAVPLGAASVAAHIKKKFTDAVSIEIVDCYMQESLAEQIGKLLIHKPDCIGLSLYLWNRGISLAIIQGVKKALPECSIFVGGPEPTARPEFYRNEPSIDYVFAGEAEEQVLPVISHLHGLPETGTPVSSLLPLLPDLHLLPSPYLDGTLDIGRYDGGALWELSRGCPFKCGFCFESRGNSGIRRFSEDRIIPELELFRDSGVQDIFVLDPTFNYDRNQAKRLLSLFADIAPDIHYSMEIRAELLDEELCTLFAGIACTLQIGLQSIHPEVLKKVNRTFTKKLFTQKVFLLHQAHVPYGIDLMYGLPGDTLAGFIESIDYTLSLVPNHIDLFALSVLPGTELYSLAGEYGLSFSEADSWRVTETPDFPAEDLKTADKLSAVIDLYYNRGQAAPWFDIILSSLGMSPSDFFISITAVIEDFSDGLLDTWEPLSFQLETTEEVFRQMKVPEYFPLVQDLITYFGKTSNLLTEEKEYDAYALSGLPGLITPNATLALAEFSHDVLSLVEFCSQGITQFTDLMELCPSEKVRLAFYMIDGEFASYYASEEEFSFLQAGMEGDSVLVSGFAENPLNQELIRNMISSGVLDRKG